MPAKKPVKPKKSPRKRKLRSADFCGDGEPYTEVDVSISIRVLGGRVNRSRLAVNIFPDPVLERHAIEAAPRANYGLDERQVFGLCLSKNFNAYEDMNGDFPLIDAQSKGGYKNEEAKRMNAYIIKSVKFALALHKSAMAEALQSEADDIAASGQPIM